MNVLDTVAYGIVVGLSLFLLTVALYTLGQMTIQTGVNDGPHSSRWYIIEGFKLLICIIIMGTAVLTLTNVILWGFNHVFSLGLFL